MLVWILGYAVFILVVLLCLMHRGAERAEREFNRAMECASLREHQLLRELGACKGVNL